MVKNEGNFAIFTVQDFGIGMPEDKKAKVFEVPAMGSFFFVFLLRTTFNVSRVERPSAWDEEEEPKGQFLHNI